VKNVRGVLTCSKSKFTLRIIKTPEKTPEKIGRGAGVSTPKWGSLPTVGKISLFGPLPCPIGEAQAEGNVSSIYWLLRQQVVVTEINKRNSKMFFVIKKRLKYLKYSRDVFCLGTNSISLSYRTNVKELTGSKQTNLKQRLKYALLWKQIVKMYNTIKPKIHFC